MKTAKAIMSIFIIFSILFTIFHGAENIRGNSATELSIEYKGIITMWQVDIFEGGTGSRRQFLLEMARGFERKNQGVLIMVTDFTKEGAEENFAKGIYPDLISFGCGVNVDKPGEMNVSRFTIGGTIDDKVYATPWCRGGYILITNPKLASKTSDVLNEVIVSQTFYTQPLTALAEEGITAEKIRVLSPMEAYVDFCAGKAAYMVGTQRDIIRLSNRGMEVITRPLGKYNDLFQYVSITSRDELKRYYAEEFAEYLVSDAVQEKLSKIGMFSPYKIVSYENEHLSAMQYAVNCYTSSAFCSEAFYEKMRFLSLEAALGDANAADKIKNMLLSS